MKYGILTFHNIPNIGALLQAIGLCKAIRDIGVDCEIIDYKCDNIAKRELTCPTHKNLIKSIILKLLWYKTRKKIKSCMEYMKSMNFYSSENYDKECISASNNVYDGFISGSDMIWNTDVTGSDYTYMLDFAYENKAKISYGSSIGAEWHDEEVDRVKILLSRYDKLSVREHDTCERICAMGLDCVHVSDPTMLVGSDYWKAQSVKPDIQRYVLVYFNSKELITAAKRYATTHGLQVVLITNLPFTTNKTVYPQNPPEWLGYFLYADAVFTNSYHGLLFSLYFNKDVWTANYGNRILSLINKLDMPQILLKNDMQLNNKIDYLACQEKLKILKEESMNYLRKAITI